MTLARVTTIKVRGTVVGRRVYVMCPACDAEGWSGLHAVDIVGPGGEVPPLCWSWNGDLEAPTVAPSILVTRGPDENKICHSFLVNGVWQYCSDSTHRMRGQSAPLMALPSWLLDE